MRLSLRAGAAALAIALLPLLAAHADARGNNPLKPIHDAFAAFNAQDYAAVPAPYAPDAAITDDFAPYAWTGAGAAARWIAAFAAYGRAMKIAHVRGELGPPVSVMVNGSTAYAVLPVAFTGKMNGKPFGESGTMAFGLRKAGGRWVIVTQAWSLARRAGG